MRGARPGQGFTLVVEPGAEPWAPPPEVISQLQEYFSPLQSTREGDTVVKIIPRSQVKRYTGIDLPKNTFRAVTRGNRTWIAAGDGETRMSIAWLVAHELSHRLVDITPTLEGALADAQARDPGLHKADDRYHELDPEERLCDGIATNLIGQRLDRAWWRARVGPSAPIPDKFGATSRFSGLRCLC